MRRVIWPALLLVLACACTVVDRSEGDKLTPEEVKEKKRQLEYLDAQKAIKAAKIEGAGHEVDLTKRELDKTRRERDKLSKELDIRFEKMEEMVAEARELARKLRPPTAEEENTAERLLLEAKFFQRDNPTEAKPVITAKYKKVFETYPRTKAAKEAKEIFDKLGE